MEKEQKGQEGDEEKTKLVNIESDQEREEVNNIPTPTKLATAPQSTAPISKQDQEINQLIDDLTKLVDDDDKVPINMLKRK
ncbi:hypothetical protein J1N35_011302 [Gossypium stocksii]|uniref:Uncharacterized protein n=1 Tax=Gossypium stocksii TaxID=47602 RepID=A0A9D4AD55_9ROSI|nr:hypothetical protein J1N35_011302 [Gossypium stocksii]